LAILIIPMFFIVPGFVLIIFGLKNNYRIFISLGIMLFIFGMFFISWKISRSITAAMLLCLGISEILRYLLCIRIKTHLAVGTALITASIAVIFGIKAVLVFIILVLILIKQKELK